MVEHLGLSTTTSAPPQPAAVLRHGMAKSALSPTLSAHQPPVTVGLSPQGSLAVSGFNAPAGASRGEDGGDVAALLATLSKLGQGFRKAAAAARLQQACGRLNALKEASRMLAAGGNPRAAIQMAREAAALAKEVNAAAKDYAALCGAEAEAEAEPASAPAIAAACAGGDPQAGASDAGHDDSHDGAAPGGAAQPPPPPTESTTALAQGRSAIDDAKIILQRAKRVVAAALQVQRYTARQHIPAVSQQDLGDLRKAQADIGAVADGMGASGM